MFSEQALPSTLARQHIICFVFRTRERQDKKKGEVKKNVLVAWPASQF